MLLGNDEAEQAQIAQPLDEFRGLRRLPIPALEVLAAGGEELIDGLDHQAEHFPILLAHARIGKKAVLDDAPRQQTLRDTHECNLLCDPVDDEIPYAVVADIIGKFAV